MRNDCWSASHEIQAALQPDMDKTAGGAVLYCKNGRHWKYSAEGHLIFLGVSGSGKTRRGTVPMVRSFIEAKESFVVIDPKGDLYRTNAPYLGADYKKHVIDFRHIYESECCNILAAPAELYQSGEPGKKQAAMEMIDDLAYTLYPVAKSADPFWAESARSVFIGVCYALMEHACKEEINMASVYRFIAKGEESFGTGNYLKEFLNLFSSDSIASMLLQSYVSTAKETRAGIRSVFLEGLSIFAKSEGIVSMTGFDDLHINQLDGEQPTAIFIILPDETPIYDKIGTILTSQLMGHYIRLAQDKYSGRLPRRINFLVEEAGNVGRIGALGHLMSAGRSRNVRVQLVLQNYSQLDMLYGSAEASTIRSNADVLVAFRTNHWETLTELSHKCGERQIEGNGYSSRESLITPGQLAAMKTGQCLVMLGGAVKFISWIPDYTEIFDYRKWKAPAHKTHPRPKKAAIFHIDEYVKNILRKRGEELILSSHAVPRQPFSIDSLFSFSEEENEEESLLKSEETSPMPDTGETASSENPKTFRVAVLEIGDTKVKTVRALQKASGMSLKEAVENLKDLPRTLKFTSLEDARKTMRLLQEAGALVVSLDF